MPYAAWCCCGCQRFKCDAAASTLVEAPLPQALQVPELHVSYQGLQTRPPLPGQNPGYGNTLGIHVHHLALSTILTRVGTLSRWDFCWVNPVWEDRPCCPDEPGWNVDCDGFPPPSDYLFKYSQCLGGKVTSIPVSVYSVHWRMDYVVHPITQTPNLRMRMVARNKYVSGGTFDYIHTFCGWQFSEDETLCQGNPHSGLFYQQNNVSDELDCQALPTACELGGSACSPVPTGEWWPFGICPCCPDQGLPQSCCSNGSDEKYGYLI